MRGAVRTKRGCAVWLLLTTCVCLAAGAWPAWPMWPSLSLPVAPPSLGALVGSASSALQWHLDVARRFLRHAPPVPEPPPEATVLCRALGRDCEMHRARTADGYVLTLVRVPPAARRAVPVLLMHGNLATSDSWLLRKDRGNLAMVLHEAGYDVWLGNFRGNTHSRQHVYLNASDEQFWQWSFHEMGVYDIPAFVDYILARTGHRDLHYLGHSMATSAALVTLSTRPEYNAKVRFAGLMGPAVRVRGVLQLFYNLAFYQFRDVAQDFLRQAGIWDIAPRSPLVHFIADLFCMDDSPFVALCYAGLEIAMGQGHRDQRLPDYLATVAAYHPAGTSFRVLDHFGAINLSGRFRPLGKGLYDPNPPPDYNLTAITAPVGLYYSANDRTMSLQDVEALGRKLHNLEESYLLPTKQFNHLDFMWARDAKALFYDHLIQKMKSIDFRRQARGFQ